MTVLFNFRCFIDITSSFSMVHLYSRIQFLILICFVIAVTLITFVKFAKNANKVDAITVFNILGNIHIIVRFVQT
jgi:hypothetical protein